MIMDSQQPQLSEPVIINREWLEQLVQHTVGEAQATVQHALDRARSARTEFWLPSRDGCANHALFVQARVAVDKLARLRQCLEAQGEPVEQLAAYESTLGKVVDVLRAPAATSISAEIDYDELERSVASPPFQLTLKSTPQEQGLRVLDTLERWHASLALKRRKRSYRAQRTAFRLTLVSLTLGVSSLSAITFLPPKGDGLQRTVGELQDALQGILAKLGSGNQTTVSAIEAEQQNSSREAEKQDSLRWGVPASSVSEVRRNVIEALTKKPAKEPANPEATTHESPPKSEAGQPDNRQLFEALKTLDGSLDEVEVLPTQVMDIVKADQEQSAKLWTTLAVVACVLLMVALGFVGWLVSKAMSLSRQHMASSVQSEHRAGLARLAKVRLALHGDESVRSTLDQIALVPERRMDHDEDVEHDEA